MLYWLSAFSDVIGPLNVLRYITFRTGGAMITAVRGVREDNHPRGATDDQPSDF